MRLNKFFFYKTTKISFHRRKISFLEWSFIYREAALEGKQCDKYCLTCKHQCSILFRKVKSE